MANLNELIKQLAMDAVKESKPCDLIIGIVESVSPLVIVVDKLTLDEDFIILTNAVQDHYVDVSVSHTTKANTVEVSHSHSYSGNTETANIDTHYHSVSGGTGNTNTSDVVDSSTEHNHAYSGTTSQYTATSTSHDHRYSGKKKMLMHYGLKTGESVLLLRVSNGQRFIVLDRIGEPQTGGEWIDT